MVYDPDGIDQVFPSIASFKLMLDIENTYDRSGPPAARLIALNDHLTAYKTALTDINTLSGWEIVMAYDVNGTPLWP